MDNLTIWLMEKLPVPFVQHNKESVLYINPAFKCLISEQTKLDNFDFIGWLDEAIKDKKQTQLFFEALEQDKELIIITEGYVKGTVHYWTIYSFPVPLNGSSTTSRITWFADSSSAHLNKSYWDLHLRVSKATMQLIKEVNERKKAEEKAMSLNDELVKLQDDLISASRQAGMAEVAASVLHNIGNVLNSVNVSIEVIKDNQHSSLFKRISMLSEMLKEHATNLMDYFQNDEKGKLLPNYLTIIFEELGAYKTKIDEEIKRLKDQYLIIKDILNAQNEIAGHPTALEKVFLTELIDNSLQIIFTEDSIITKKITINKNYKYNLPIITNKVGLMQIIVNLLKNAKESLEELDEDRSRRINISLDSNIDDNFIEVKVMDNGIGISLEDQEKMFRFGFTTKKQGHGFGLHHSALLAKQLGGSLAVESEGLGKGATFLLRLPITDSSESVQ
ncbi:hypothetical protein EP47_07065 [Legionella norrlandica]|uniref:histidine kinase n=1 Tax=Legionella norrlandica TaxID=1498499 RepID=A0A0A2SW18_9GAMM|nr:ATP-binding protein [Legionella norrlandica]KGP63891.1 hypothetical protein EP47_07065 [Legionella norrlandica]